VIDVALQLDSLFLDVVLLHRTEGIVCPVVTEMIEIRPVLEI
jgi:hypothetical protein